MFTVECKEGFKRFKKLFLCWFVFSRSSRVRHNFANPGHESVIPTDRSESAHEDADVNSARQIFKGVVDFAMRTRIFVAYPYRLFEREPYRAVYQMLERQFPVEFVFADDSITNTHILEKIKKQIRESAFGLYDISGWNPNVTLELGYAIGITKPTFLLIDPTKASGSPADLGGIDRIEFRSLNEMNTKLEDLLRQEVRTVTFGSRIVLQHVVTGCFLSASERRYTHTGTSGQRMLGGSQSLPGKLGVWTVVGPHGTNEDHKTGCNVGDKDQIRLKNELLEGFLHSHHPLSPITRQQEATLYDRGASDSQDNWQLEVELSEVWTKWDRVKLHLVSTGYAALHSHNQKLPHGELEITCFRENDENDWWRVVEIT